MSISFIVCTVHIDIGTHGSIGCGPTARKRTSDGGNR